MKNNKDIPTADILEWCKKRNYALVAREDFPYLFKDIVRCGECKHSKEWYGDHRLCYLWSETGIGVFEDGFCSYGERKE